MRGDLEMIHWQLFSGPGPNEEGDQARRVQEGSGSGLGGNEQLLEETKVEQSRGRRVGGERRLPE